MRIDCIANLSVTDIHNIYENPSLRIIETLNILGTGFLQNKDHSNKRALKEIYSKH